MNGYNFTTSCPLCNETLDARGSTSDVIYKAQENHLVSEHETDELLSHYLAQEIVSENK